MHSVAAHTRRDLVLAQAGWLLVVVAVISWRRGTIYSGGLDPVVVGKALVTVAAVAVAAVTFRLSGGRHRASLVPGALVVGAVAVSILGAATHGTLTSTLALAVRVLLLAAAVVLLMRATAPDRAITMLLTAMGGVGLLAALTGAVAFAISPDKYGRLGGGIPGLAPNELAGLALPVAFGLIHVLVRNGLRPLPAVGLIAATAVVLWTQSRTVLALLILGAVVLLVLSGRFSRRTLGIALGLLVAAVLVLAVTGVLADLVLRGRDLERLFTLSARTWVWQHLFAGLDPSGWWIGHGLSVQTIVAPDFVHRTDIHAQPFDSSWVSAIAQSGLIGTAVMAVYAIGTVVAVVRSRPVEPLWIVLVAGILVRSLVENGLIGSSPTFVIFLALATALWRPARRSSPASAKPEVTQDVTPTPELGRR